MLFPRCEDVCFSGSRGAENVKSVPVSSGANAPRAAIVDSASQFTSKIFHEYRVVGSANLRRALYASSGVIKVFLFDRASKDVPSFGALPRPVWTALGIIELFGTVALVLPGVLQSHTNLTFAATIVRCVESLLFIWVHMKYIEKTPIIMSAVLGIIMAVIAYGRFALARL